MKRFRISEKEYKRITGKEISKKQKRYKYICSVCGKPVKEFDSFSMDKNEERIHLSCGLKIN